MPDKLLKPQTEKIKIHVCFPEHRKDNKKNLIIRSDSSCKKLDFDSLSVIGKIPF
jgi:hypothetical protein